MSAVRPYEVRDCEVASTDEVRQLRVELASARRSALEFEEAMLTTNRELIALRVRIREEAERQDRLGQTHTATVLRHLLARR